MRGALLFLALLSCRPDIDDDASKVVTPRIVAVQSIPAEVRPNERATFRAIYSDPSRPGATTGLDWRLCSTRRALAEAQPVDPDCLAGNGAIALGQGPQITGTMPRDACRTFGPDRPLGKPGEPGGRPADPDGTGGFFQPGIVTSGQVAAQFDLRIRCSLAGVTQDVSSAYEARYRPNANPVLTAVTLAGAPIRGPLRVARGSRQVLRAAWPTCTDPTIDCGGAETYTSLDQDTRSLVDRREAMTVTWLATRGHFGLPHTGRAEDDPATTSDNDWTASDDGDGELYVVLRDARGGVTWKTLAVHVE